MAGKAERFSGLLQAAKLTRSEPFDSFQQMLETVKDLAKKETLEAVVEQDEPMVMLNLMYAPRRTKFYSLVQTLARIENLSYIVAWTKQSSLGEIVKRKSHADSLLVGCPHIDLVELPRIKLTLFAKPDHLGEMRLYSSPSDRFQK